MKNTIKSTNTTANANANTTEITNANASTSTATKLKTEYYNAKGRKLDWIDRLGHKLLVLLGCELESVEESSGTAPQYKITNGPSGPKRELVSKGTPAYRKVTFKANPAFPAKVSWFKTKVKKLFHLFGKVGNLILCLCLGLLGFIILMLTLRHFVPELGESMKSVFEFIENWALPMVNRAFKLATEWLCEHCM